MRRISDRRRQCGFTLAEMIVAITVTAILSGIVALFIRVPLQGYFDVSRRAGLTDEADLAVRRIAREIQGALPNSVRLSTVGGVTYLEFLAVRSGGRYRAAVDGAGAGDILDFVSAADNSFDVFGLGVRVAAGDQIVVYNLGVTGADAYAGDNRRAFSGVPGAALTNIAFTNTAVPYPFDSPSHRFFVVSEPVTYACAPAAGGGTLSRYGAYPIAAAQPTPPGVAPTLLAGGVTACAIGYNASSAATRNAVVTLNLTLTRSDAAGNAESVTLYAQAHVVNAP